MSIGKVCFVHAFRYTRLLREPNANFHQRPRLGPHQIQVLDFSPIGIRRHKDLYGDETTFTGDTAQHTLVQESGLIVRNQLFDEVIESRLPYVERCMNETFQTEGVMIGEDSLIVSKAS